MKLPMTLCSAALILTAVQARAQGASDLFLIELREQSGALTAGAVTRLTNRPGYDNQPSFVPGSNYVLYTSIDSAGQADIWRVDLQSGKTERVTRTQPESEYSGTVMPAGDRFSAVRVERDSTQRLWSFQLDGSDPRLVLEHIKPVGYHAWIDSARVVVFVLGDPPTLQLADARTGAARPIASNVGRALQRVSRRHAVSFVETHADSTRWIKIYDADAHTTEPLIRTLAENEYHAWTPTGALITARGSQLYTWRPGTPAEWLPFADLRENGVADISRLTISPDGRWLVVVGAE